jgi:hypothetical protein
LKAGWCAHHFIEEFDAQWGARRKAGGDWQGNDGRRAEEGLPNPVQRRIGLTGLSRVVRPVWEKK